MKIGVLALQGAVAEHIQILNKLDVNASAVRLASQFRGLDGLIIPGGESTTIGKLLQDYEMLEPLREMARSGFPVFGTCAGMILLAKTASALPYQTLGLIDMEVERNGFGRQVDSFEADLSIPELGDIPFHGVFIRAPVITRVLNGAQVLCTYNGKPAAIRQGKALACAFHPELTDDTRFHKYFLTMIEEEDAAKGNN